jgi:hypothetical protein
VMDGVDVAELKYGVERMRRHPTVGSARLSVSTEWTDSAPRSAGIGYDLVTPRELT